MIDDILLAFAYLYHNEISHLKISMSLVIVVVSRFHELCCPLVWWVTYLDNVGSGFPLTLVNHLLQGVLRRRPKRSSLSFCRQQISQLMTRCAEVLSSVYAPVPEDADDEDAWDSTTNFFNGTRNVERGNRHVRENTCFFFNIGVFWDVMFAIWKLFIQIALKTAVAVFFEA